MNEYLKERNLWYPVSAELMASYCDGSHSEKRPDGTLEWVKNGQLHRDLDKPAYIGAKGLAWYKNGKKQRDDNKPVVIWHDGTVEWWTNGLRGRLNGPSVIFPRGHCEWVINGKWITDDVKKWLKVRQYTYPFTPEQQVEFALTFS
jgi:hypothetical protein